MANSAGAQDPWFCAAFGPYLEDPDLFDPFASDPAQPVSQTPVTLLFGGTWGSVSYPAFGPPTVQGGEIRVPVGLRTGGPATFIVWFDEVEVGLLE